MDAAYRIAFTDWLACAWRGRSEPAAQTARHAGDVTLWLGTAGHVLDFDDTYLPGLAHLSAPTAPAALAVGAEVGATIGEVLIAYAAGFEAMGALARASHPALYDRGLHPTAVCGTVGAAVAAGVLLKLDQRATEAALGLAALRATGTRAGFGSDGKALGVGLAAAEGVAVARLAAGGARVPARAREAFAQGTGGRWADAEPDTLAVAENWIKPWPCCLMAQSAIEAALTLRDAPAGPPSGSLVVRLHPRARQAAAYDDVADPLQAKFSIPYLTMYALLRGDPDLASFAAVDEEVRAAAAARVRVIEDALLGETEARIEDADGVVLAQVAHALGSPERPMDEPALASKVRILAGGALDEVLDDSRAPAAALLSRMMAL